MKTCKSISRIIPVFFAITIFVLVFAVPTFAHRSPEGCNGSGLGITLFASQMSAHAGDTITYSVDVFNGMYGPIVCDATNITASVTTPDLEIHPITLTRTALSSTDIDHYPNIVSYIVRSADVNTDNLLTATAIDTGTIHQNDTDSTGGSNQGVNVNYIKDETPITPVATTTEPTITPPVAPPPPPPPPPSPPVISSVSYGCNSGCGGGSYLPIILTPVIAEVVPPTTSEIIIYPYYYPQVQFPNTGIDPFEISFFPAKNDFNYTGDQKNDSETITDKTTIPIYLSIPIIDVSAKVEITKIAKDNAIGAPKSPSNVAWLSTSAIPGQIGTAIIDGHFGWKDGIPAVFDNISKLHTGDEISITDSRSIITTFVVRESRIYGENENTNSVFEPLDGKAHLDLITCAGVWNASKKSYSDRLVVFADKKITN